MGEDITTRAVRPSRRPAWAAFAAVAPPVCGASHAAYVKSYNAGGQTPAPDPTTPAGGSWSIGGTSPGNVAKGPGAEGGQNYWEVVDTNTNFNTGLAQNNSVNYNVSGGTVAAPGDQALIDALTSDDGWKVTFTLKVVNSANPTLTPPSYNVPTVVDVRNGRRIYDLAFVNDGANEGVYRVASGTAFTADSSTLVAALDLDQYHTFEMVYVPNPADHTQDVVNVYIDGAATPDFTFDDSNSGASTAYRVLWGTGLTAATHTVRWREVTFESPVPEPGPVAIVGPAGVMLFRRRRRSAVKVTAEA